jgi:hypothetical protein
MHPYLCKDHHFERMIMNVSDVGVILFTLCNTQLYNILRKRELLILRNTKNENPGSLKTTFNI